MDQANEKKMEAINALGEGEDLSHTHTDLTPSLLLILLQLQLFQILELIWD